MANRHRGEVPLEHDGKVYVLRFGINEICDLETSLDMPINEILAVMNDGDRVRIGFLRSLVHRALIGGGADMDERTAGDLIGDIGMPKVMEKLGEAFKAAFPDADKEENPPKAR